MTPTPFSLRDPLPRGTTVLEASAGTGKTYAIAALVARLIATGTPPEALLVVTFTRMATGELRERVRERLVAVADGLDRALDGEPAGADEVVALLAEEDVAERRDRLRRGLADFDAAAIATTHGFCQEALANLGVTADVDLDATFAEDVSDLVEEVVDDLYLRRFAGEERPAIDRAQAGAIARAAVGNPLAPLEPADPGNAPTVPGMRRRLADAVRKELEARKRRLAVMTYDDLLTRLDGTLRGDGGEAAVQRLRRRFPIVLIDEFQDTDPVQWDIIERAFGQDPEGTLVLIGDPKQAVYAFRGADVYAYLRAARAADFTHTLETNHRSDERYLQACEALFAEAELGERGIVFRPVRAAPANHGSRLLGAPERAPLRLRLVARDAVETNRSGLPVPARVREHVAADLAGDVVALLASDARIEPRDAEGAPAGDPVSVRPGDVAVLVRTNAGAALVREALDAVGVPAVIAGAGSVFETRAATDWLRLLEALERPSAVRPAHAAALTPFLGWDARRVALAADAEWEVVHGRLHRWARVLRARGVAALAETMTLVGGLPARVLGEADGERRLTDLRHVAQLLHEAASTDALGVTALAGWLRRRIAEAAREGDEERSRRLESDAEAVQILTVHRAKGLEFPIVYLPSLWDVVWRPDDARPVAYHDPAAGDRRTIDVGLEGEDYDAHRARAMTEERGEDLRLAYVALTRARHQAIAWWAPTFGSRESALSRLVLDRGADGSVPERGARVPSDEDARERFAALGPPDLVRVEAAVPRPPARYGAAPRAPGTLEAAAFGRDLDRDWRRTSFSDLTAGTYEARVASEPEERGVDDEPDGPAGGAAAAPGDDWLRERPAALTAMPMGTRVGTAIHSVMETVDFAAPDLDAALHDALDAVGGTDVLGDRDAVVAGLRGVLETPLGPLTAPGGPDGGGASSTDPGGLRLADLARADRLDELSFELPLLGGERPTGRLDLAAVGALLRDTLPAGDPLAPYAARLEDPALRQGVRGYLTGSIDLVLRTGDRFLVVDFKTNWLAPPEEPLTAWHHRPAALAREMVHHHYALQALLYSAALHRFLRWRLADYDPERHLGGVLYLFLRGMTGPATPTVDGVPCGVFSWRPPAATVTGLSDLLDRG